MLNLIKCEFWKLKRRKFILLTILAAALFPIPMVIFAQKENLEFDYKVGDMLNLPYKDEQFDCIYCR